jgi:glycosyltransferase involved in cell wall biosynthesis
VHFLGAVPPRELAALYARAAVLLHLSTCESFGLPVAEAMRFGLPVVAAAHSTAREVAGDAALLVEPDDLDSVGAAIEQLVGDEELRRELTMRGRRRAAELTWRRTAERVAEVTREALDTRAAS